MDTKNLIRELLAEAENQLKAATLEMKRAPRGRLSICKQDDGIRFIKEIYQNNKRIRKGIGKDPDMVYRLAHKAYMEEYIRRLKINHDCLASATRQLLDMDTQTILGQIPQNYSFLDPAYIMYPQLRNKDILYPRPSRNIGPVQLKTDIGDLSPFEWACMPYCENTSHLEHKIHITSKGLKARSKSEVSLLENCENRNLFYHYDETFLIGREWISPDIIMARPDGKLIIHEHLGLDDLKYHERNRRKLMLYESAGFRQGRNLILTFDDESGALDMKLVNALLDHYMR